MVSLHDISEKNEAFSQDLGPSEEKGSRPDSRRKGPPMVHRCPAGQPGGACAHDDERGAHETWGQVLPCRHPCLPAGRSSSDGGRMQE